MKITSFTVPGEPVAKARARVFFNKRANRVMSMTPTKTATYEQFIKLIAADFFPAPATGPVIMSIRVFRGTPKSLSKKLHEQAEAGTLRPTTRPDVDNYLKSCMDALNGISFRDDSQVIGVHVDKFYSANPRTEIDVEEL